jgi:hypothetical protein
MPFRRKQQSRKDGVKELTNDTGTGTGILVPITVSTVPNAAARLNSLDSAAGSAL